MLRLASFGMLTVAAISAAMFLLAWFQPAPFRHICSVFLPA